MHDQLPSLMGWWRVGLDGSGVRGAAAAGYGILSPVRRGRIFGMIF